jgi:hypothetical protein
MDMNNKPLLTTTIILLFTSFIGCAGPKEQGCGGEFDQSKRNAEATVSLANQLKVEGKLTSQELIKVDQEAGLYSKRLRDLCVFLESKRISFEEYDAGVTKANHDYQQIREFLTSAQKKP